MGGITHESNQCGQQGPLFEELVKQVQVQGNAAGIAVAIVDEEGKTQYEQYFGYRDTEQKLPMDENTIFGLASVTKSFVALSIMQLAKKAFWTWTIL